MNFSDFNFKLSPMKNIFFFLIIFFNSGLVYSQDSSKKLAVGEQSRINKASNSSISGKSNLDQSTRGIKSVNSTDTLQQQTKGDIKDNRRIILMENDNKSEPK